MNYDIIIIMACYKYLFCFLIFTGLALGFGPASGLWHSHALAQDNPLPLDPDYKPTTTSQQVCFTATSKIEHTTYVQVVSNYYQDEQGNWVRHRHNFKIKGGEEYPVCTTGPFFEDRKILIRVKSLIPLLSCYFDLGNGGRTLTFFHKNTQDGVKRLWANCDIVYPDIN